MQFDDIIVYHHHLVLYELYNQFQHPGLELQTAVASKQSHGTENGFMFIVK